MSCSDLVLKYSEPTGCSNIPAALTTSTEVTAQMAKRQNTTKPSFVYACVSDDGKYVKIGFTTNPKNRIPHVRTAFRQRFGVESKCLGWHPGTLEDERALQVAMQGYETAGYANDGTTLSMDWFHASDVVLDALRAAGFEVPQ